MSTPTNWWLIGGIIGGVVLIAGIASYWLLRRRRKGTA